MASIKVDIPAVIEDLSDSDGLLNTVVKTPTEASSNESVPDLHQHKRARDVEPEDTSSKKRAEVLKQRRQTVLQLYQQHAEKSSSSEKILSRLKDMYKYKLLPIERDYQMHAFCLPTQGEIQDAEFDAKPMVLLIGPYSTGKTTFISHLLGGDFPGCHIGPEPTSDKFMALVHGNEDGVSYDDDEEVQAHHYFTENDDEKKHLPGKIIKGNTLTVTPELPFASLASFGSAFLNHFDGSVCASPLLRNLTLIDTPGVLSGEKQRLNRSYNFAEAAKWFADRSDLILLILDAHKLDVSDEFKEVVETIRPHNDDKMRCILNKADAVTREQFVRVYGSLMWSMGKLFESPEVVRVYTGSYWDEPLKHNDFQSMFESDEWLLIDELMNLPAVSAERKVNAMVKRIRLVKVHVCLLGYLGQQMPLFLGRDAARKELLRNMNGVFLKVGKLYKLAAGDMPDVKEFCEVLESFSDWTKFLVPSEETLEQLDNLIREEIPSIIKYSPSKKKAGRRAESKGVSVEEKREGVVSNRFSWITAVAVLAVGAIFTLLVVFVWIPMMRQEPLIHVGIPAFSRLANKYINTIENTENEEL